MGKTPFWKQKTLAEMSRAEWESLCDGCAKCCCVRLEDDDTGDIHITSAACKLLNRETARCSDYANRKKYVPDCVILTKDNVSDLHWMPRTCAYRLIAEGKDLFDWHPLVSGDPDSVHKAGMSVAGKTVSELGIADEDMVDYITIWPGEPDHGRG